MDGPLQTHIADQTDAFVEVVAKHVPLFSANKRTDDVESKLATAALRFLGYFIASTHVIEHMTVPQQEAITAMLKANLIGYANRDKTSMIFTIWCFTMQRFNKAVVEPHVGEITQALRDIGQADFKSSTITLESLFCMMR